jgi:3-dehydroquinate synthetase
MLKMIILSRQARGTKWANFKTRRFSQVVALDEREAGVRGTLNWGHTIGHAIEAIKSPAMMHGECVAIGCVVEGELALRMGYKSLTREKMERVAKCFTSYGLPIHVPGGLDEETMCKKIGMDKKNKGNSIRCTIITDIGVSIADPQPCEWTLIAKVIAESTAAGAALPEWQPHEGNHDKTSSGQAGGFMGGR